LDSLMLKICKFIYIWFILVNIEILNIESLNLSVNNYQRQFFTLKMCEWVYSFDHWFFFFFSHKKREVLYDIFILFLTIKYMALIIMSINKYTMKSYSMLPCLFNTPIHLFPYALSFTIFTKLIYQAKY
jgi:hypothetical protein